MADDIQLKREIVLEADAETLQEMCGVLAKKAA